MSIALALALLASDVLDARVTFSRTSLGTCVDATGKITYAPNNLLLRSQQLDTSWTAENATITADAATAPDGSTTADKIIGSVGGGNHDVYQNAGTIGATEILSVYLKAGEKNYGAIQAGSGFAYFNLAAGTAGTSSGVLASGMIAVGNGWYRCWIKVLRASDTKNIIASTNVDNNPVWTGNGTDGIYAWGAQLEAITYQAAPTTYMATSSAAYHGPRYGYVPATLAPRGLLVEESRTNDLLRSAQLDNGTSWQKTQGSVTADAGTAPDGTASADKFIPNTSSANHIIEQTIASTSGTVRTFSFFAKDAGYSKGLVICTDNTTGSMSAHFDLVAVTVTPSGGGSWTAVSAAIEDAGGGYYRISVTGTQGAGTNVTNQIYVKDAAGSTTFAGDGTSGMLIWGGQFETGHFASSHIPTMGSTVSRSADVADMTSTNFSSWYNATEGTFVAEVELLALPTSGNTTLYSAYLDADNNLRGWVWGGANTAARGLSRASASDQADIAAGTIAAKTRFLSAFAYKANDFAHSVNGSAVGTDVAGSLPAPTKLSLGNLGGGSMLNGYLRRLIYDNTRRSNSDLQALTTIIAGAAAITEGSDTVTATGIVKIKANAAIIEGADIASGTGEVGPAAVVPSSRTLTL
jgi:hypothetical protein